NAVSTGYEPFKFPGAYPIDPGLGEGPRSEYEGWGGRVGNTHPIRGSGGDIGRIPRTFRVYRAVGPLDHQQERRAVRWLDPTQTRVSLRRARDQSSSSTPAAHRRGAERVPASRLLRGQAIDKLAERRVPVVAREQEPKD